MKLQIFTFVAIAAALPAFAAAPSCGTFQVVGTQCATNIIFPWGTAGGGTDSLVTFFVPPTVSAPVTFQVTQFNSSLGSSYTGFFGLFGAFIGSSNAPHVITVSSVSPLVFGPGEGGILHVTNVCFDPTCTAAPPTGAVGNMFSAQLQVLAASAADLNILVPSLLTVRFLNADGSVSFEEQEQAYGITAGVTEAVVDSVAEAAMPDNRYVYSGTAVTLPFMVFSITNPSATVSLSGTAYLFDAGGGIAAQATIPAIPPGGAVGYLLIGRSPGDTLGLFPSSTVFPLSSTDSTGTYHGAFAVELNNPGIFLAQQFNGFAMLNLVVFP